MKLIKQIQEFIDNLEAKEFYTYMGSLFGLILLLFFLAIYRLYSSIDYYKTQIRKTNVQREEIRELLEMASSTKTQKQTINAMLEADPDFKIANYFKKIVAQIGLTHKQTLITFPTEERGEKDYNESILSAKFIDMNMKDVTELLEILEQNKRIYTKSLELQRSRKSPRTLEVQLTIATLKPRTELTEYME